jgi:SMC interacting uncharacterized protein involved in chromosome segregation
MTFPKIKPMIPLKPTPSEPTSTPTPSAEEYKDPNLKYNLSKFEYDLYHEEDDIAETVIRVKRISMPNKGDKWKVMHDNRLIFTIESTKISKKEREYLQTLEGFNFILKQAKQGIKSLNSFCSELKKIIIKPSAKRTRSVKPKKGKKNKRA